ncbi:general transcription factor II-I repeat domain-containing protein 2 [Trichonephila clavipes]|nr:general transcription factor II-I repeat domain-containing protein 2 [Trichonephila clavipes]
MALPLSAKTIKDRTIKMCSNITTQHIEDLKLVSALSIAVDESCDINHTAQVSLFVRFMSHPGPKEELLALLPLKGQTREDIAYTVIECMDKLHIPFDKIVSISTDGAKSMTGVRKGFVSILKEKINHEILAYHCIIHQEVLCRQTFPDEICKVMQLGIAIINSILAKALNHRQFREFLFEMESESADLLLHNKLRWLSRGNVLKRFASLFPEIKAFLLEKGVHYPELTDDQWIQNFYFMLTMKHATSLAFSHPRAKRVCFDKDNGKASFKPDAVPENHFHLGSHNYAVVSDFADVARIHLRRYKLDATGSLLPTKDGITVTPSVWLALVREFSAIDQAFEDGKVFVIKDCLLLSRTVIENVTHIIMQRYFQRKDFTRKFLTPVSMLKETEWNVLKDIHKQITSKTVSIMFGRVFLKLLRQEVAKHIPFPKSDCVDCIDAEMVLTTSMVELLCNHIEENISSLFVCFGCLEGYENQLGHECMTYSNGQRISDYGDLAILNMDWDKLVADFVNRNIQMVNYMNEMFLNKLNMNVLIENAKQMYVARDSLLLL